MRKAKFEQANKVKLISGGAEMTIAKVVLEEAKIGPKVGQFTGFYVCIWQDLHGTPFQKNYVEEVLELV